MHVRAIHQSQAIPMCTEMLHGDDLVGRERTQDVRQSQCLGVALAERVIGEKFLNCPDSLFDGCFSVYVKSESVVSVC